MTAPRPSAEHGVPGHLNAFVLDQDGESTGYGTHARCIVTGSMDGREVTVHVDHDVPHLRGLAAPTADQVRKVAMGETYQIRWSGAIPAGGDCGDERGRMIDCRALCTESGGIIVEIRARSLGGMPRPSNPWIRLEPGSMTRDRVLLAFIDALLAQETSPR